MVELGMGRVVGMGMLERVVGMKIIDGIVGMGWLMGFLLWNG